jgi:hypothetical protein
MLDDILKLDDKIDSLSDDDVIEIYVRRRLYLLFRDSHLRKLMSRYGPGNEQIFKHEDRAEQVLSHYHEGEIKNWVRDWAIRYPDLLDLDDVPDDEYIDAAFDVLTKENLDRDYRASVVRDDLKRAARGSIGMPDSKILRSLVRQMT